MAEPLDIELQLYSHLWDLFEAYEPWATLVLPGARHRYDHVVGDENPEQTVHVDSDYPSAEMDIASGETDMWDTDPTFATHALGGPLDNIERHTLVYRAVLISQLLHTQESTNLGRFTRNAIRRAGPKLGLDYVVGVKFKWFVTRRDNMPNDGLTREVTTMDITVVSEIPGSVMKGT